MWQRYIDMANAHLSLFRLFIDEDEEDPDDIMCNFIPMVKEYLTCKSGSVTHA
jgi:hypothetical protein